MAQGTYPELATRLHLKALGIDGEETDGSLLIISSCARTDFLATHLLNLKTHKQRKRCYNLLKVTKKRSATDRIVLVGLPVLKGSDCYLRLGPILLYPPRRGNACRNEPPPHNIPNGDHHTPPPWFNSRLRDEIWDVASSWYLHP